jgi:dolichol-phosphate mannosyltransferase
MKIKKLTIVIPVFNEIKTIGLVLEKLQKIKWKREVEVIVVDDGSTDGTTEFLRSEIRSRPTSCKASFGAGISVITLFHKGNLGKGAAVKTALEKATGEFVIIQDADLEYSPFEIEKLVEKAERDDLLVVYGSRNREAKNRYLYPHYYWGSRLLYEMINILFGQKLTDPETCYKLLHRELFKFIEIGERGFGIEIEITAKVSQLQIPIGEVPISYKPRTFAEGKKIRAKDGLEAIYLIWKYWSNDMHYGMVDRWLRKVRFGAVLSYLKFQKEETVVDLGCGRQARLGWILRGRIGRYIGIDTEVPQLLMGNISLMRADLDKPVLGLDGKADKVIGAAILEHLEKPEIFLKRCAKILKKGGVLVLTTPAPPMADLILKLLVVVRAIKADEVFDHKHYYDLEGLRKIADKAGLKTVLAKKFLLGTNNLLIAKK